MTYDDMNQLFDDTLRSLGGTSPHGWEVAVTDLSDDYIVEMACNYLLRNIIDKTIKEVELLAPNSTYTVGSLIDCARKHYQQVKDCYVVLAGSDAFYEFMSASQDTGYVSPHAPAEKEPQYPHAYASLFGMPLAVEPRIAASRVLILRRGWFQYANHKTTHARLRPIFLSAKAEAHIDTRGEGLLANNTIVRISPEHVILWDAQ